MGHCQAALLADRAVFRMTGTDARKFLQGMLTNDVGKLSDGEAMHAGLLSPQGKILFELFVVAGEGRFPHRRGEGQDGRADQAARLLSPAGRRSTMAEEPGLKVAAVWGGVASPSRGRDLLCRSTPRRARVARASSRGRERERARLCRCHAKPIIMPCGSSSACLKAGAITAFGDTFPARGPVRPIERRRLQEGLLCRPGARVAHGASRACAEAHRSGRGRCCAAVAPARRLRPVASPIGTLGSVEPAPRGWR